MSSRRDTPVEDIPVVILAGGMGTRLREASERLPKPLVEIGERPILWHIMKLYGAYGFNEFVVCLGYKGYMIKEYFSNYFLHTADVTFGIADNTMEVHQNTAEPWRVTLVDTGADTMTGGRVARVRGYLGDETFMLTYGDGVSDVNILDLLAYHRRHGKQATLCAVQPTGRFGAMVLDGGDRVVSFEEKPKGDGRWVNGGFFVLEPDVFDYVEGDDTVWEEVPLQSLCRGDELIAYRHRGFWMCMDTLRDRKQLESLWDSGHPPWRIWNEKARYDLESDVAPTRRKMRVS